MSKKKELNGGDWWLRQAMVHRNSRYSGGIWRLLQRLLPPSESNNEVFSSVSSSCAPAYWYYLIIWKKSKYRHGTAQWEQYQRRTELFQYPHPRKNSFSLACTNVSRQQQMSIIRLLIMRIRRENDCYGFNLTKKLGSQNVSTTKFPNGSLAKNLDY